MSPFDHLFVYIPIIRLRPLLKDEVMSADRRIAYGLSDDKKDRAPFVRRPLASNFPVDLIVGYDISDTKSKEVVTNQTVRPPFNERVIKKNDW